jgi:16S rRNA (cytosine967-C5)-methyltransferase
VLWRPAHAFQLEWLINKLMSRPMTGKQRTVHYLIMVGFYQLLHTRIPPHAALAETVEGAVAIKRPQLKGLINGVLRQFQRQQESFWLNLPGPRISTCTRRGCLIVLKSVSSSSGRTLPTPTSVRRCGLRVNRNHHTRDAWLALLKNLV